MRSIYEHLDDELAQIAKEILQQAPLLRHVSVEYLPQIGYLIAIHEQDQHFLPSTTNPITPTNNVIHQENDSIWQPSPQSCTYDGLHEDRWQQPHRLDSDNATNQQQQKGFVFPPEYQHIYTSEGIC